MEIAPVNPTLFRIAVDALKDFLPQGELIVSSSGVRMNGMDASHVGFVDYFLAAADCTTLTVPTPCRIGINTHILARTLGTISSGDRVSLSTNKEKLVVTYVNEKVGKKAVYEMNTLDISEEGLELPNTEYAATIDIKTYDLAQALKEVSAFGETIQFKLDEAGFHISTTGDAGSVCQTLENTDDRTMDLTEDSVVAGYGSKYLMNIMKGAASLSPTVKIEFDATQPLRASFLFGSGSHFVAYLAPKIIE